MESKFESIFQAIYQNNGEIAWARENNQDGSPYGMAVAKVNGTPVAAAWITDGDCEYFDPDELADKLAEYDAVIAEAKEDSKE